MDFKDLMILKRSKHIMHASIILLSNKVEGRCTCFITKDRVLDAISTFKDVQVITLYEFFFRPIMHSLCLSVFATSSKYIRTTIDYGGIILLLGPGRQ